MTSSHILRVNLLFKSITIASIFLKKKKKRNCKIEVLRIRTKLITHPFKKNKISVIIICNGKNTLLEHYEENSFSLNICI